MSSLGAKWLDRVLSLRGLVSHCELFKCSNTIAPVLGLEWVDMQSIENP